MKATIVFEKNWNAIHEKCPKYCNGNKDCDWCFGSNRKYKYIVNCGSSRSSKTYSLIDCFDLYARSNMNKRLTVWRDTKTDCKKTVLHDTLKHLKTTNRYKVKQDFNKTESIFTYDTGSTFEIHGTDDEETVHGLSQNAAWLNEPYKISKDTFDQIDQRTADFLFIDWNPKRKHWIDDLSKSKRCITIHSTFKDNPLCPIEEKIKILSYQPLKLCEVVESKLLTEDEATTYDCLINSKELHQRQLNELLRCQENELKRTASIFNWQVYGLGIKSEKPNRIFNWSEISDSDYAKIDKKVYIGVDWGAVDPFAIVEVKYDDGNLYCKELNYLSENELRGRLTMTELAQIRGEEEGLVLYMFRKLGISKSTHIVCDNNRPLKIAILRQNGYYAMPVGGKGTNIDGIDLMQDLNIFYTASSENIKYEQENYSRQTDRTGYILEEPQDVDNHTIDSLKYTCIYLKRLGIIKNKSQ